VSSASAQPPTRRRSLFRHPDYARLWTAATVSLFGTQVSQIAIPFIAAVLLNASPGQVGLLVTIEFLPFLLFTLPAGVWVDRYPRKRILVIGDIGRGLMLLSIPIAYPLGLLTIWQLYLVGFVNGIMTVFFDVADQSYLPSILDREDLVDGNAKLQISQSSAQILGQPFGGGIVAVLTAPVAILIDAISYFGSAGLIVSIRGRRQAAKAAAAEAEERATATAAAPPVETVDDVEPSPAAAASVAVEASVAEPAATEGSDATDRPQSGMRSQIAEGLRYILGHRFLANIAASTATSNLCGNIALATFPVYAYRILELSPAAVGTIGGIGGAGVLVGALLASRVASRFGIGRTIVGSIALGQVAGLLVPIASKDLAFWFFSVAFFIGSIANVIYNVNQVSLRQAITPEAFLGRMNATMRFLVWGTIPIGSLIGAGLSEVVGVHTTIWIGAILGLGTFLPVLLSPVRSLKEIPTVEAEAAASG
jgi:MFS family permease